MLGGQPILGRASRPVDQQAHALPSAGQLRGGIQPIERAPLREDLARGGPQTYACRYVESTAACPHRHLELGTVRNDHFRGCRWRRGPHVGGKVCERDIHLMTDAADHRDAVGGDRAYDRFIVERPEILQGAATACQDRHGGRLVGPPGGDPFGGVTLHPPKRSHQARGRILTLDLRGHEEDPGQRPAAPEDMADVLPDGSGRARDHGDGRRSRRQ